MTILQTKLKAMADKGGHRNNDQQERMEDDANDLEGSERDVTESLVEDQLDNQSIKSTGLSEQASRIRVEVGIFWILSGFTAVGIKHKHHP